MSKNFIINIHNTCIYMISYSLYIQPIYSLHLLKMFQFALFTIFPRNRVKNRTHPLCEITFAYILFCIFVCLLFNLCPRAVFFPHSKIPYQYCLFYPQHLYIWIKLPLKHLLKEKFNDLNLSVYSKYHKVVCSFSNDLSFS